MLLELRKQCPWVFGKLEVYIDGGFERGSDILKAIALGATAVGIGRPYLYSLLYGQEGVQHLTQSTSSFSFPLLLPSFASPLSLFVFSPQTVHRIPFILWNPTRG